MPDLVITEFSTREAGRQNKTYDQPATQYSRRKWAWGPYAKSRIYIFPEGESIWENLQNRRNRPVVTYRQEIIPEVLERAGLPADTRVIWSQKAGCSCGCSPAFIVQADNQERKVDYFVTIRLNETVEPAPVETAA